jgi:hypothetical protein
VASLFKSGLVFVCVGVKGVEFGVGGVDLRFRIVVSDIACVLPIMRRKIRLKSGGC